MTITLRQLAEWVDGEIDGDGDLAIEAARGLKEARAGDITFATDDRHVDELHHSPASAAVVRRDARRGTKPLIRVHDPLSAFSDIFARLQPRKPDNEPGVHPSAVIHPTAALGPDVRVDAFVSVGAGTIIGAGCRLHAGTVIGANCRLGDNVTLHPHVVLYDGTILGRDVIIHAHSVIGADGFGYRWTNGRHVKVPQLGFVEIADGVEIGSCTTIDRGTFGATRVGEGTKIDNLVQIGHNCRIGNHNVIVSQVGIAGSCTTGERVIFTGQAGIADHVHIGAGATILPQAGVNRNIQDGESVMGTPAMPMRDFKLVSAALTRLPEMRRMLRRIAKHLGLDGGES